ncbi:AMP-binding protein [Aquihabitans daechungensis]|uniref:AMP-binding protein n=1 Tax=Aquihabitans daechungensis TaxID=1052257 RepID=UPI003BA1AC61
MTPWDPHLPAGTPPDAVEHLGGRSLVAAWTERWAADPGHRVVFDDAGGWVTAAELEQRSRTIAGRMAAAGLGPGDRMLLSAGASVALVVAHVAALRLGLVVVPANTSYLERELTHVVRDAQPALAVVDAADRGRWIAAAGGGEVVVTGTDVALPDGPDPAWLDGAAADDAAVLAYTSGTTGAPKGALLSHRNLLASVQALGLAWRWDPGDRLVLPLPLFHMHGLGVGLHGTLTAGAGVVLRPSFDAADVLDAVEAHQGTLLFGVPTMWSRLAATGRIGELAALRVGVSGSAPLDPHLHEAIAHASGHHLIERYGMTETVMLTSNPYDGERRAGTVGLPLPRVDLRLAEGTEEIEVRGANVFAGYWQRPDATAESFHDDWFATGDVGAIDDDGYVRIVGRRKELIISGGFNVYPREVEDVLRSHPSVADAAVVGVPHPEWGEQVVAAVEGAGPADVAALQALARDQLAPYKRPKRIVIVDALPRNALGKVVRADVLPLVR